MAHWSPGENVVVLGAGATRGAEWVEPTSACLPPLNADFFTQLQRIQSTKHQGVVSDILRDVVGLYGPNFSLTLEQYFTQLETMVEMSELVDLKAPRYTRERLGNMKLRLLLGVSAVLEESADVVKVTSEACKNPCGYHRALVEAMSPRDTIISFNYDCVIDHALKTAGAEKWSAQYGYGFNEPHRLVGFEKWNAPDAPERENASVNLLKLHGSLNFFPFPEDGGEIRLRERPYRQTGNEVYEIIPPEFAKRIDRPEFQTLWRRAERAVRLAKKVTLIGFSFTPTDTHVDSFFRTALAGNTKLEEVIIVNPSQNDRRRIRSVFGTQLSRGKVRVVQFDYLSEFAHQAKAVLAHG
jgi:hypothetical protein